MKKEQKKSIAKNFPVRFSRFLTESKKFVSHLFFPEDMKCVFCGADIPNFDEQPYCEECARTLPFNNGHRCVVCDAPLESEASICDFCQKEKKYFKKAFCPFIYEGSVKNTILAFKDSNQRWRAKSFANMIAKRLDGADFDIITYIPMTEKKQKKRSFNQAQLLAEELGKIFQKPVLCCFEKTRDEKAQKTLSFRERREAMVGSYKLKRIRLAKSQNVLIVDDIITTCATINYCAGLIYPKVNNVFVCAIARQYIRPDIKTPHYDLEFVSPTTKK